MNNIKSQIESVFNALQGLDIKPTLTNTRIILGCLRTLQDIYAQLDEEADNGGSEDCAE